MITSISAAFCVAVTFNVVLYNCVYLSHLSVLSTDTAGAYYPADCLEGQRIISVRIFSVPADI